MPGPTMQSVCAHQKLLDERIADPAVSRFDKLCALVEKGLAQKSTYDMGRCLRRMEEILDELKREQQQQQQQQPARPRSSAKR